MATLYTAMDRSLLVATDEHGTWRTSEAVRGRELACVLASPDRPDCVLVGTFDDGLQRSRDAGETFERVGETTIESDAVMSLAVDPSDPAVWWAGTEPSAVYRSGDGGETWEQKSGLTALPSADRWSFPPRPDTHHVRWLAVDPHDSDRLYVGIEAGAFVRTADGGETWQDHPEGARYDNHALETHHAVQGLVYTAAGDGFAVSRDGGDTWRHPQAGLDHRYCWSVVADPGDPERLVMSAARSARTAHSPDTAESYVYRRIAESDWKRVESDVLPTGEGALRAVLATTAESGVVYAASNHGLYRSDDTGRTWSALGVDWPERFTHRTCHGLAVVP